MNKWKTMPSPKQGRSLTRRLVGEDRRGSIGSGPS